jgi:flagellar motor switch protein FliN/FliY
MENEQDSIKAGHGSGSENEQSDMPQDTAKDEEVTDQTDSYVENQENSGNWNINLLLDVELPVRVSFGQTEMQLRDVFKLGAGSVIELDKSVNDPVTVIVNNKPIAKGEVVMVDGNYGVRILEVESTADRIRSLG